MVNPPSSPGADPGAALFGLLTTVRPRLIAAVVLSAAGAVVGVVGFLLVALTMRELLADEPVRDTVVVLIVGAGVGLLGRFLLRSWAFRASHLASYDLEVHLRTQVAEHLGRVPLGEVQRLGSGTVKKVVQDDVRALHMAVADATPLLGFSIAQPIAALIAIGLIDWRLLLAVLAIVPLVIVGMRLSMKDYADRRRRYDQANEAINGAVVEFVQGMPVVRTFDDGTTSFRRFARRVQEFTVATAEWQDSSRFAMIFSRAAMTPLPTLVIVLAVGTWLTTTGAMAPADLLVALVLGTLPVESILPLIYLSHYINESKAGAARIAELLAIEPLPEPAEPQIPRDGSIRFEGVTFSYGRMRDDAERERPALDGIDLDIAAGTVCALVGPSGSGKSTIARLIPRFWDVVSGTVFVGGVDVRRISSDVLLGHVAMVFQDPFLLDDTVAENIRLARPEASDEEVQAAARAAHAHDFIVEELPEGYQTPVGERGSRLSGGQRQRITIARAMLSQAPIVLLDEATAFADPESEAAIQAAVAALTRGRTVVVIAHRLSTIVEADQIVVLDEGRVAQRGTHQHLLDSSGRYAQLWAHHQRARTWGLDTRVSGRREKAERR